MSIQQSCIKTRIQLEVLTADDSVKSKHIFSNVVTNVGLQHWAKAPFGTHLAIGAGARDELETVSSLASFVRSAQGTYLTIESNGVDETESYGTYTQRFSVLFPVESVSQNYSEIGLHDGNQNALHTYAKIKNTDGTPTTVSVLAGERIRAEYDIKYFHPLVREIGTFTIAGTQTVVTEVVRALAGSNAVRLPNTNKTYIRAFEGTLDIPSPFTSLPGGVVARANASHSNGIFRHTIGSGEWDFPNGIGVITYGNMNIDGVGVSLHFSPPIKKNAGDLLSISLINNLSNGA